LALFSRQIGVSSQLTENAEYARTLSLRHFAGLICRQKDASKLKIEFGVLCEVEGQRHLVR
jgi:hypothetical protein